MKAIYKFKWESSYSLIEGIFCAKKKEIEKAIGKQIYLGEVSGKHSEVYGTLDWEDLKIVSEDPCVIKVFEENSLTSGFNPLYYLDENE